MAKGIVPYMSAYGNITKALEKLQKAATPDRFSQDFLATKLGMKGGSAKPVIPFLKRVGFLSSDGSPTNLYERFRNKGQAGAAAAEALRRGYSALYDVNQYIHDASDDDLKGVVVQVTGMGRDSKTLGAVLGSFKALRAFADFDVAEEEAASSLTADEQATAPRPTPTIAGLNLGYTINLHLPATSDVAVFNAIFKSLSENLLSR